MQGQRNLKNKSVTTLLKSDVDKWKILTKEASELEEIITDRITYIIKFWHSMFNISFFTWYFDGAGEGEVGDLYANFGPMEISSINADVGKGAITIIDKYNNEYCWDSAIPTRWLFEDFEQEITDGKRKYIDFLNAKKEAVLKNKKESKINKDKLIESAKSKLTKEELEAISSLASISN